MKILAHHGTEFGQTLRAELTAEGRDFREVAPARSIEEIAPHQLSWRIDVAVYRFHAQKIEDRENIPVHLVEIKEALPPDGVYYHSIVVDDMPTDAQLAILVRRRMRSPAKRDNQLINAAGALL